MVLFACSLNFFQPFSSRKISRYTQWLTSENLLSTFDISSLDCLRSRDNLWGNASMFGVYWYVFVLSAVSHKITRYEDVALFADVAPVPQYDESQPISEEEYMF